MPFPFNIAAPLIVSICLMEDADSFKGDFKATLIESQVIVSVLN